MLGIPDARRSMGSKDVFLIYSRHVFLLEDMVARVISGLEWNKKSAKIDKTFIRV
jgi:hypothetical protein